MLAKQTWCWLQWVTIYAAAILATPLHADDAAPDWKVGPRLRQQLELPADFFWRANPLRPALSNLSARQEIAIFLDRRVDPDQPVNFAAQNASLEASLSGLADQLGLSVGRVHDVIYLGPPETATKLATLVQLRTEEARKLPMPVQRRLLQRAPVAWPMLAEPRELLAQISEDAGVRIQGLQRVPHDLWPAVNLPPLSPIERLTLLLAGFGATFQFDATGESIHMTSIPEKVAIQRTYAFTKAPPNHVERLQEMFPTSQFALAGGRLQVDGPWETHEMVDRLLRGETVRRTVPAGAETRYTLTVQNQSAQAVLQTIATKLMVELNVEPAAAERARQLVTFTVENATLAELLTAIARPAGLTARVEGKQLIVVAVP